MSWPLESVEDLGEEEMLAIAMAVSLSESQQKEHLNHKSDVSSPQAAAGINCSKPISPAQEAQEAQEGQMSEGASSKVSYRDKIVEPHRTSSVEQMVTACERRMSDVRQEDSARQAKKDYAVFMGRGYGCCWRVPALDDRLWSLQVRTMSQRRRIHHGHARASSARSCRSDTLTVCLSSRKSIRPGL